MHTCYEMYRQTATGLAPESGRFNAEDPRFAMTTVQAQNLLRPETVESLFILHRVTGNPMYLDWGWHIFRAFDLHSKWPEGGYTSTENIASANLKRKDKMESFFIAETLKYLLLLFSPAEVRLCAVCLLTCY